MFTVLRLIGDSAIASAAADAINAVTPGTIAARNAPDSGYGASVCDSNDWRDHVGAMEAFVGAHGETLAAASKSGVSVEFDTAIEPDDPRGHLYTSFGCPPGLHRDLGAIGASLVLTWYEGGQA